MVKYPETPQFRSIIRGVRTQHDYKGKDENGNAIYQHTSAYPTLKFHGTVKVHGTNASVVRYQASWGETYTEYQSRTRVLRLDQDNAGFMLAMSGKNLDFLFKDIDFKDQVVVFGEWAGKGIQKGVAVSELPKMFIIFGVQVDGEWVDIRRSDHEQGIYHIEDFATFDVDIDFNDPEGIQNKLIELTLEVERECPVGKYFGVIGTGEGLVFSCANDPSIKFKSKGEKHSNSKVKVLNPVDTEEIESINEFVEYAVTENRLRQGLENVPSQDPKYTGEFIKWVIGDVMKEESDTIVANQIDVKKANSRIAQKARVFFLTNV